MAKKKTTKKYILDMFPYPSGEGLHIGHVESYTATDILSRYYRMKGENVLHPQGWDAFGLPAENYAIKTGIHPSETTKKSINTFKSQMKKMDFSYNWSREINSSDPEYYKWTQWFFLLLYKNGLAYRAKAKVNWCKNCKTVLANEQAEGGKCERCESEVMQKELEQWFFKITDFIEDIQGSTLKNKKVEPLITSGLISGLKKIDWPESTKAAQKNWIGRSEGALIKFPISIQGSTLKNEKVKPLKNLEVFTTRLDTIYGCTYCVVAPEHSLITDYKSKITNYDEVKKYLIQAQNKTELERIESKDKTGVEIKGIKAINPFTNEEVPIFVADYVLGHYGTGAVMAVPAHDERDWEFAEKNKIIRKHVINPVSEKNINVANVYPVFSPKLKARENIESATERWKKQEFNLIRKGERCFTEDGILVNSEKYSGMTSEKAQEEMVKWLEKSNLGSRKINYKLRDWLVSRQRYWGAPIPIIYCDNCANKKEQVLMLHGWEDNSRSGFFPSLKVNLEEKGYEVFAFDAPNTDKPNFDEWYNFAEEKIKENKLEKFHIIGHSMGGHLAAKLAEKYKLKSLTLVAPVGFKPSEGYFKQLTNELSEKEIKIFKEYQDRNLAIDKVKKNTGRTNIVFGAKDNWIESRIRNYYVENFKDTARIKILDEYAHMSESEGVKRVEFLESLFSQSNPGIVPVPEGNLPVILPDDVDFKPTGESPLVHSKKFHNVKCPVCGTKARRESDTMDTFVCSSWYYFRYADPKNNKEFASKKEIKKWLPVDIYVGGAEHSVLHLLYSRFFTKVLHKLEYIDFDEPFLKLRHQGIILGEDGFKMSKSRGNIVNPDDVIKKYGSDALRIFEMFMGPLEDMKPWNAEGIIGLKRFLDKVWKLHTRIVANDKTINANGEIGSLVHKTIKKVTEDIENFRFNTAVSAMMILVNEMEKEKELPVTDYKLLVTILSPFAPHIAEELWQKTRTNAEKTGADQRGKDQCKSAYISVFEEKWPKYDPRLVKDEKIELVIQVNGKVRDRIETEAGIPEEKAKELALGSEKVRKFTGGKEVKKTIFVKGKLINVVT